MNDSQDKSESIDVQHNTIGPGPSQFRSQVQFPEIDTRRLLQSSQHNSVDMPQSARSDNFDLRSLDLAKVEKELVSISDQRREPFQEEKILL